MHAHQCLPPSMYPFHWHLLLLCWISGLLCCVTLHKNLQSNSCCLLSTRATSEAGEPSVMCIYICCFMLVCLNYRSLSIQRLGSHLSLSPRFFHLASSAFVLDFRTHELCGLAQNLQRIQETMRTMVTSMTPCLNQLMQSSNASSAAEVRCLFLASPANTC